MQSVGRSDTEEEHAGIAMEPDAARSQILENLPRRIHSQKGEPSASGGNKFSSSLIFMIAVLTTSLLVIIIGHTIMPDLVGDAFIALAAIIVTLLATALGIAWLRHRSVLYLVDPAPGHGPLDAVTGKLEREYSELLLRYREAKIRAEASERAKLTFLSHLNHDLRTPLNHIIGFADLIGHQAFGPLGDERYLTYANDISSSGKQLLVSLSNVLELAEFDSGARVLRIQNICLEQLFSALKARFEASAKRAGVYLDIKNPSGIELDGDKMCLQRMMGNLIDNAVRFTPAGGRIYVDAWVAEDGIVLEVTDTGIGISEQRIRTLSEPFNMEEVLETRNQGGMGLGLAISKAIAELSGGQLAIQSTPSIGTTVAVSLPLRTKINRDENIAA